MKHFLTFLRRGVGLTLALTVGSPSADRRLTVGGTTLKHLAFMLLFLIGSLNVWGAKITNYTSIESGKKYYIGATTGNTDYYLSVNGSSTSTSIAGSAVTSASSATVFVFAGSGTSWTIKFDDSDYYLGLKNGKDNGKVQVVESAATFTASNQSSKIRFTIGSYSVQKNNSGTQFGSYANTQTDVWLEEVPGGPSQPTLSSIQVSGTPTTTTYEEGNLFDVDGLVVTGTYGEGGPATITEGITWKARTNDNSNDAVALANYTLSQGQTSLQVQATVSEIPSAWYTINGLTVNEHVVTPGTYSSRTMGYAFWGLAAETTTATSANAIDYSKSFNDITVNIKNGDKTNQYFKNDHTRVYSGGYTMTFSVPSGFVITNITYTATNANNSWSGAGNTASVGTLDSDGKVWTGKANSVTITFGGTCQIASVSVTYAADVKYAVNFSAPTGGTLVIKDGDDAISSGDLFSEGKTLSVDIAPTSTYIGGTVVVKKASDESVVTDDVLEGTTLTVPDYAITVSATFTPTYAITKEAEGGSIELEYTAAGAPEGRATAGTEIMATATPDANHIFNSLTLSNNVADPDIDENVATFTMPAGDVTVTATFDEKADPYITLSQTEDYLFDDVAEGASTNMTFTVSGANLSSNLSVAVSGEDAAKFGLSATSITISEGIVTNYEVTVTPVTSVAGTFGATITVDDGENGAPAQSFDIAITVLPKYTAKWIVNGNTESPYSSQTAVAGTELIVPNNPAATGNCAGLTFMGWVSEAIEESQDEAPSYVNTENLTMPNDDVTYYAVFAEETPGEEVVKTYSHTIDAKTWSSAGAQTLSSVAWTLANDGNYYNYDGTKGQQVGSGNYPASEMSLTTSGISGKITSVKIYTSGAKDVVATVAASVNGVAYKNDNSTSPVAISSTNTVYEFTGSETGEIVISWAQTSSKAIYFKQIEVKYATPGAPTYSNYVTICVDCSNVSLVEAGETNGTITLKEGIKEVSSVKTCNGAVTLTTNAVAETGYELTNIALSGVANATVNQEMTEITIPANAEGTLTVTATFSQKNYEVALAQSPAAGATLDGAKENAHYGETINISTSVPDGYMFAGWTPANLFANTEAANAISTSFTMPNNNVTVTANFTQIYTVADALALVPDAGDNSDYVYVGGLISYVDETSWDENYKNINYYISANGTRENELLVYHGYKGYDKETFDAITDIKAGDKVIVYGKLTNYQGTKEFAQNNKSGVYSYIYQFTEAILSSVEVGGTLTKTDYFINDDFTREGLTATAVYSNTGYSKDITDEATWTDDLAGGKVTEDGTIRVTATYNLVSGYKDVEVTVTTKVLESIELSETALTGYLGQAVQKPAIVTAHFDDNGVKTTENVTAFASFDDSDYDASSTAEQTITVSYQFGNAPAQTADYTITLSSIRNTIETAYTVEKGRSIIDLDNLAENNLELDDEGNKVFVQGYITDITSNKYTIKDNIEDTKFIEISEGTLGDGISSVKVGDLIKVEGNLYFYENNSHTVQKHQILNGEIVAVVRTPNLTVDDVAEMEVNFTADLAEADLTIDRDGSEGAITFSCSDAAVTIVDNKLHAAEAGDATVTATIAADGVYTAAETTFNVHVIAERTRYAITMDANGGSGEDPVYANQLAEATVNLPATCPYSKANSAFAGWVVTYGENVSVEVTDGHFTMPAAAVTIKATWNVVATCTISFKVGGETVTTANAPQTDPYTITQVGAAVEGFTFLGWSETEVSDEVEDLPTMITSYTPEAGEGTKDLFGIYSRVDESDPNYGKYEKVTAAPANWSGQYLIVYENGNKAMDGSLSSMTSSGNGIDVTIVDGVVTATTTANKTLDGSSFTIANAETNYSIRSASGKYIGCTSSSNGFNEDETTIYTNAISLTEITSSGGPKLQCWVQSNNYQFKYYASSQNALALYKKNFGTTYYTSSPVEKVTITFDANGGNGGCAKAIINKGSQLTICDEAPTKSQSDFAGWKNGDDEYVAGQAYTFNASITLTAQWEVAATYAVTYNVNGSTADAPTQDAQYAGDQFTIAAAIARDGYTFQGWKYGSKLYKASVQFTMPAEAVEFVAQWKKSDIETDKMLLVTEASALATGMQVALGCSYVKDEQSYFEMAGDITGTNKYMTSVSDGVSLSNGVATYPEDVVVLTLEQVEGGWKIAKNSTNYLTLSDGDIKWDTQANATVWTISFEGNNVAIANGNNKIQFNSNSPRFKTYTSNQKAIQLFSKAIVVTENVNISDLGYVDGEVIVASGEGVTVTIDQGINVQSITAKNGAAIEVEATTTAESLNVEGGATVTLNDDVTTPEFSISNDGSNSGQVIINNANNLHLSGNAYFDFTLEPGQEHAKYGYYAFCVPFPVNSNTGITTPNNDFLQDGVDYVLYYYDGAVRATGAYGWKRFHGTLTPGVFYMISLYADENGECQYNTIRFMMDNLQNGYECKGVGEATVSYAENSSGNDDDPNAGWNGVGNPTLQNVKATADAGYNTIMQIYDRVNNVFTDAAAGTDVFQIGIPFFIQSKQDGDLAFADGNATLAPSRISERAMSRIRVNFGNETYTDHLYVSASEDALNSYELCKDMAKMSMGTAKVAQISSRNYGVNLLVEHAPLVNDQATYQLNLYAPAAGTYSISAQQVEGATLYVTYNGAIVWNLSLGDYELDLTRGTTTGYGLLLVAQPNQMPTGVENGELLNGENGVQKILLNGNLYILRDGHLYDAVGKQAR